MTPSAASQQSQSSNGSANTLVEGLQLPLKNALSSLNINLDYELARYRYAKRGEGQPTVQPTTQFQPRQRSLDLANVPMPSKRSRRVANPSLPPPPPPNPRIYPPSTEVGEAGPAVEGYPARTPSDGLMSEVAALRSAIVHQPGRQQETDLASSEALLETFGTPSSPPSESAAFTQRTAKPWFETLNTPLGLGALMLLLVASAGFGFLLINPSAAQNLFSNTPFARLWSNPEGDIEVSSTDPALAESDEAPASEEAPITGLSPDLSKQEFSNLDLNTLSNLPSNSMRPAIEASPSDAGEANLRTAPTERETLTTSSASGVTQEVNEIPRTTTPAPRPTPVAPTYQEPNSATSPVPQPTPSEAEENDQSTSSPVTESTSSAAPIAENTPPASQKPTTTYYVVTDYTGDPSLNNAREQIGDAYVRNFDVGARIQLGAFSSETGASALVEELETQGIEAEIYEP